MSKSKPSKRKADPPKAPYPLSPYIAGMNYLEVPVTDPELAAETYRSLGFEHRMAPDGKTSVAVGGLVLRFNKRRGRKTGSPGAGFVLELAVDHAGRKREQLKSLGLKPGAIKKQERGDLAFDWKDPDGHVVRFVGPDRSEPNDGG